MIRYSLIPDDIAGTQDRIKDYIERGCTMPDLLLNVVSNDLIRVMTSLPDNRLDYLHKLVLWLYTEAPAQSIGSRDNMLRWIDRGGRQGIQRQHEEAKKYLILPSPPYVRHVPHIYEPMD